jgi:hypothetical protein
MAAERAASRSLCWQGSLPGVGPAGRHRNLKQPVGRMKETTAKKLANLKKETRVSLRESGEGSLSAAARPKT